ncbi:cytochrome c oxidase assembly protein COX15 homolog [Hydractinia symbiolongicarpus]|uniref:cytochrome c oxidase assembly protein COX15 homolog n=1 Tax=Hydractinia symbiolongicarpus TaxID=13093 RepID=UPI00254C7846|nr:cytochrome c oxidase assembly protein COX15 homolog [Hydractinia symbiolongicarpus]
MMTFSLIQRATPLRNLRCVQARLFGSLTTKKVNHKLLQQVKSKFCSTTSSNTVSKAQKLVGYWLLGCSGAVAGAVTLGGITRLTKSGLSMTDWHLIRGMKPPRSHEEWMSEFERYQSFPEFKLARSDMTLNEFKTIFYMEYYHRMYGRFVGLAFYIPAGYFWYKGFFSKGMKTRAVIFGSLILGQGLLGWYMVKSGLNDQSRANTNEPRVSQYRLAAHLGLAFTVFSGLFYQSLAHLLKENPIKYTKEIGRLKKFAHTSMALTFVTAMSGAFVAGLEAGLVYNSFPKFADRWIPSDIAALNPWWKNLFENPTTTQFNHRILGTTTFASVATVFYLARPLGLPPRARLAANCLLGMACVQVGLGIATLLLYVPTHLAASHQFGSLSLLSVAIWLNYELKSGKIPK